MPSVRPDLALNAHFPTAIDGQPVTIFTSTPWLDYMCMFGGGQEGVNRDISSNHVPGFHLATSSGGVATATVDGESVELSAFREPGADSDSLVLYSEYTLGLPGTATLANIDGRSVLVWTDTDGSKIYAYTTGDTIIAFGYVTDSQASKIIAALP